MPSKYKEASLESFYESNLPSYALRCSYVLEQMHKHENEMTRICEFGSNNLYFLWRVFGKIQFLKLEEANAVDINEKPMLKCRYKVRSSDPLCNNVMRNISPVIRGYKGCISVPFAPLQGMDLIVATEVIEHLEPFILEALPLNIFGYLQPKYVIFTTPNSEYNALLDIKGFRHPDHKFEWDRTQFADWVENICQRFPNYTYNIDGIGRRETKYGCTSQVVKFTRIEYVPPNTDGLSYGICFHEAKWRPKHPKKYEMVFEEKHSIVSKETYTQMKVVEFMNELFDNSEKAQRNKLLTIPVAEFTWKFNEKQYMYEKKPIEINEEMAVQMAKKACCDIKRRKIPRKGFVECILYSG